MVYNVKNEEGNVIADPNKINEKWQSCFKNLLNAGVEDIVENIKNKEKIALSMIIYTA